MLILVFNTTDEHGGAALYRGAECLARAVNAGSESYSITLFEAVERLLQESQLSLGDVDLFAVASGPGSFTGIRIGVAAAQGWGTALGRPVCGVSLLAALVEEARPEAELAMALQDARRGEFFLHLFRRATAAGYRPAGEASLVKLDAAQQLIQRQGERGNLTLVYREHDLAPLKLRDLFPDARWQAVPGPLLDGIARLALRAHAQGNLQTPDQLDALYIRRTDAEMNWRE